MKKQLILVGISVLLIFVGLSGCSEENKQQNYLSKFIGTWRLVEVTFEGYPYGMDNHTEETWIFYENKSAKITSIHFMEYPEEPNASIIINWIYLTISDDTLTFLTGDGPVWLNYFFSYNDTQLTLTIPGNMTQKLNKIE